MTCQNNNNNNKGWFYPSLRAITWPSTELERHMRVAGLLCQRVGSTCMLKQISDMNSAIEDDKRLTIWIERLWVEEIRYEPSQLLRWTHLQNRTIKCQSNLTTIWAMKYIMTKKYKDWATELKDGLDE